MRAALAAIGLFLTLPAQAEDGGVAAIDPPLPSLHSEGGRRLTLVGTGSRERAGARLFSIALYIDEIDARRGFPALVQRAGGRGHAQLVSEDHAPVFLIWGRFTKLAILRFPRAATARELRDSFAEGLSAELSDKAPADLKKAAEAFVALFDRDVQAGDELLLRSFGEGRIEIEAGGETRALPPNPKLARALWSAWLGPHPVSKELRRTLVDKIDQLGN